MFVPGHHAAQIRGFTENARREALREAQRKAPMPAKMSVKAVNAERAKGVAGSAASTEQGPQPCDPDKLKALASSAKAKGKTYCGRYGTKACFLFFRVS